MAPKSFSQIVPDKTGVFMHGSSWIILFNSLFHYLIANALIFMLSSVSTAVMASRFGISTLVCKDQIEFLTGSCNWNQESVLSVFGTAPLMSFLTALGLIILYGYPAIGYGSLRILLAWMIILCMTNFFGGMIVGALMNRGMGYLFMYLFIMDTGRIVITLLCMMILFVFSQVFSRVFLFTANVYHNELKGREKLNFGILQFLIPFILGNMIIGLWEFPSFNLHNTCLRISSLLILIPFLIRCHSTPDLYFDENPRLLSLAISPACIALLLLLISRFVLGEGIIL
jgi:hypothetical protein